MKKVMIIAAVISPIMMAGLTGCMSDAQVASMSEGYRQFITQERYMPLQVFDFGTNGTGSVTYTGLVTMRTYAPLDKLSIMPDNPGTAREVVDGIVKVGAIAGAAYGLHELSGTGGSTTINNAAPAP